MKRKFVAFVWGAKAICQLVSFHAGSRYVCFIEPFSNCILFEFRIGQQHSHFNHDSHFTQFFFFFFLPVDGIKGKTFLGLMKALKKKYLLEIHSETVVRFILKANGINLSSIWTWRACERFPWPFVPSALKLFPSSINIYDFSSLLDKYLRSSQLRRF